jgi:hypothetical protein
VEEDTLLTRRDVVDADQGFVSDGALTPEKVVKGTAGASARRGVARQRRSVLTERDIGGPSLCTENN